MEKQFVPTDTLLSFDEIKYKEGQPRSYRYNASDGNFNLDGETVVSRKGKPFTFIPIAYRQFSAQIFGQVRRKWVEFFFLNKAGHVSAILFHGFSVQNLERLNGQIFYSDLTLLDCKLTATPEPKQNQQTGTTYFICSWSFEGLTDEEKTAASTLRDSLKIYREDSLSLDTNTLFSIGYYNEPLNRLQAAELATEERLETV